MATKNRHARSEKSIISENEDTEYANHSRKMKGRQHGAVMSFNPGLAHELGNKWLEGPAGKTPQKMQANITKPVCPEFPATQPHTNLPALTEWEKYEHARRFVCSNHVFVDVDVHPSRYKDVCASLGFEAVHCNKLSSGQLKKCLKGCGAKCPSSNCECSSSSCSSSDSSSSCSSSRLVLRLVLLVFVLRLDLPFILWQCMRILALLDQELERQCALQEARSVLSPLHPDAEL